jgi:hypothetical protein
MDHIVYLDKKAKELDNLIAGKKTMIIRGAMGRKMPYERVDIGDTLYFTENNGDGIVKAVAQVSDTIFTDKLEPEESIAIVEKLQPMLQLDTKLNKRFAGKRYLCLIGIENFREIEPFAFDKSDFCNMDDWLRVENIEKVKI